MTKEGKEAKEKARSVRPEKTREELLREEPAAVEKTERCREEAPREKDNLEERLARALRILAPGTFLREGLENILRGKMGALIVVSNAPQVMDIIEGGLFINCEYSPAYLYELAKMDGAIIIDSEVKRILYANTQLIPNPEISSQETGIRHRSAERAAKQTNELVLAISQRRGIISLFQGSLKYVLQDQGLLLVKANQALQTLEKYRLVLDKDILNLSAMEFEDLVTVFEVARILQRIELVGRIVRELKGYIIELGVEGRLVNMQLQELTHNLEEETLLIVRDYIARPGERLPAEVLAQMGRCSTEELTELSTIGRILGYGGLGNLDQSVSPRGYRLLQRLPRLPIAIIDNVIACFESLPRILKASIDELDEVEGIGEARARAIKSGLKRLQEQVIINQRL